MTAEITENQHKVIEVIRLAEANIPNGFSLPESHIIHFCKMYGITEEEQAGVLRWHNNLAKNRERRQYIRQLQDMVSLGATLMVHLPNEEIGILHDISDLDWDDDYLDITLQIYEKKVDMKVPFTTTFSLSWDKDTKLSSSLNGPEKK